MGSCLFTFLITVISILLQLFFYNNIGICFAVCMFGGAILYSIYNKNKWS